MFSSKVRNLGLEQEVVDMEGDESDSEEKDLNSKQEYMLRDELYGL